MDLWPIDLTNPLKIAETCRKEWKFHLNLALCCGSQPVLKNHANLAKLWRKREIYYKSYEISKC